MTGEQYLAIGVASCASAIVFLFGLEMKHHASTKEELRAARERLDKCESERAALSVRVALLELPGKTVEEVASTVATKLEEVARVVAAQLKEYAERITK